MQPDICYVMFIKCYVLLVCILNNQNFQDNFTHFSLEIVQNTVLLQNRPMPFEHSSIPQLIVLTEKAFFNRIWN
jgi:hypothetical protein